MNIAMIIDKERGLDIDVTLRIWHCLIDLAVRSCAPQSVLNYAQCKVHQLFTVGKLVWGRPHDKEKVMNIDVLEIFAKERGMNSVVLRMVGPSPMVYC